MPLLPASGRSDRGRLVSAPPTGSGSFLYSRPETSVPTADGYGFQNTDLAADCRTNRHAIRRDAPCALRLFEKIVQHFGQTISGPKNLTFDTGRSGIDKIAPELAPRRSQRINVAALDRRLVEPVARRAGHDLAFLPSRTTVQLLLPLDMDLSCASIIFLTLHPEQHKIFSRKTCIKTQDMVFFKYKYLLAL